MNETLPPFFVPRLEFFCEMCCKYRDIPPIEGLDPVIYYKKVQKLLKQSKATYPHPIIDALQQRCNTCHETGGTDPLLINFSCYFRDS